MIIPTFIFNLEVIPLLNNDVLPHNHTTVDNSIDKVFLCSYILML